ncbi:hypothetical protein [Streptomyces sp. NRRL F-5755]|nr:hypothetical protein [Streptomyces sp. NRRL F-5755]
MPLQAIPHARRSKRIGLRISFAVALTGVAALAGMAEIRPPPGSDGYSH